MQQSSQNQGDDAGEIKYLIKRSYRAPQRPLALIGRCDIRHTKAGALSPTLKTS